MSAPGCVASVVSWCVGRGCQDEVFCACCQFCTELCVDRSDRQTCELRFPVKRHTVLFLNGPGVFAQHPRPSPWATLLQLLSLLPDRETDSIEFFCSRMVLRFWLHPLSGKVLLCDCRTLNGVICHAQFLCNRVNQCAQQQAASRKTKDPQVFLFSGGRSPRAVAKITSKTFCKPHIPACVP